MNNEQQQIIDEVWKKYGESHWTPPENPNSKLLTPQLWSVKPMQHNKRTFINEIKTNPSFSKKWGLKIEERELSLEEKFEYVRELTTPTTNKIEQIRIALSIPTKLITITYNNEKIESYEQRIIG